MLPLLAALALALPGCGDGAPAADPAGRAGARDGRDPADSAAPAVVRVWLSRGEAPVAVERGVEEATPEAALRALLSGPTAAERESGLHSWFSAATADAVAGFERRNGLAVVDFRGLDRAIPGASSSAGSAMLLSALDSTLFQFPAVDSIEYRLDGSCAAFWEWLQRECRVVTR